MAEALSLDLRRLVVAAVEKGQSRRGAADRFGVSASSAIRWSARHRQSGDVKLGSRAAIVVRAGSRRRPSSF